MKYALLSEKTPKNCLRQLCQLGFTPLLLPPFDKLSEPVCTHADMLLFSYKDLVITHEDYYEKAKDIFDTIKNECGVSIVTTKDNIEKSYPHDIAYNAIMLGGRLYSNTKHTSTAVSSLAHEHEHVSQGYAACSTLALGEMAVITADPSLCRAYEKNNVDVCLIRQGNISLQPYEYGFIGGASGVFSDTVYFCGNIDSHPDAEMIKSMISKHGMKYISLSGEELFDVGGIKFFECK